MGIMAIGVGGDSPGFQMPSFDGISDWWGSNGSDVLGGAGIGGAVGAAAGGLLGGIPGMLGGGLLGGGIGAAAGGGLFDGIGEAVGGAASSIGDMFGGIEPWMVGTGGAGYPGGLPGMLGLSPGMGLGGGAAGGGAGMDWSGGGGATDFDYVSSDGRLKRDIAPIRGALDLLS
jgi:hypothetical protein